MHEDVADIVGMKFANQVPLVDGELEGERKATDAKNAAAGVLLSGRTYRADIERRTKRAERLSRFLMDTWVDTIRRKQGKLTKADTDFIYGEVCHFLAATPDIQIRPQTPPGTATAIQQELTRATVRLQSNIKLSLNVIYREDETLPSPRGSPETRVPEPSPSVQAQRPTIGREPWSLEARIAFWGTLALILVGLVTLIATIASPEMRRWLSLEKPPAVPAAPSTVSSGATGTRGQEDLQREEQPAVSPKPEQKRRPAVSEASPLTTPSTTTEKHKTTDSVSAVVNPAPDTALVSVDRTGAKSQARLDSKDKMNWRNHLRVGMTADEVRQLFGEPDRISTGGTMQIWHYGSGSITLDDGKIFGWNEPD